MRNVFKSVLAFLFSVSVGTALAVVDETNKLAPEPTVAVGWVYFFLCLFVGVCVWIGYAIWHADKKSRGADGRSPNQPS